MCKLLQIRGTENTKEFVDTSKVMWEDKYILDEEFDLQGMENQNDYYEI